MKKRPTYQELQNKIKELESETLLPKKAGAPSETKSVQAQQYLMEASLRESEERYRRITEAVTDYIFTVQVENGQPMRTVHGPACMAVTGYTSEEFAADPYLWIRMVQVEDHSLVQEHAARILAGQDPGPIQHRIRRKDGNVRWVNHTPVLHCDASGRLVSYDGLIRDITEHKQAEEALRLAQYSIEHVPMAAARIGPDGRLLYVNQTAKIRHGLLDKNLADLNIAHINSDLSLEKWPEFWRQVKEKKTVIFESHDKFKDGRTIPVEITAHFMEFEGQPFILGFSKDITERKQAEELNQLQRDLAIALSSSNDLKEAMNLVLLAGMQIEEIDCGGVYLVDPITGDLDLIVHCGLSHAFIEQASHYITDTPSARLIKRGQPVYTQHSQVMGKVAPALMDEGLRALAVLPVLAEGRVIAAFNLASHKHEEIPLAARSTLETLAAQIGGTILRLQAQEALRVSQYSIEHAPFPMARIDAEARFLYVNEATCRHFGHFKEELLSMGLADINPGFSIESWFRVWEKLKQKKTIVFETRLQDKKGRIFPVEITNHLMEFEGQQYVFSFAKDITERKQAENLANLQRDLAFALSSTNELNEALNLLVQTSAKIEGIDCGGIYLVDPVTGDLDLIMHVGLSDPFVERTSHFNADSPSALLVKTGKPVFSRHSQIAVNIDAERRQEGLRATAILPVQAEGRVIAVLNLASHTHDEILPVARLTLENLAAQVGGAIARLQAQAAMRQSEEKYRDLVENINEVIYSLDEKGVATYASPIIATMLGYQPSEVIGQPFAKFVFEEDLAKVKEQFNKVYADKWEPQEYRVHTKSGEPRWIRASSRPVYEEGRVVGIQGMVTDITVMKHLEAQLRQAQKMEAIGTLAGGIAHDFNNILGIIVGNTELALLDIPEASPAYHNLEEIRKACLRARDVVLQILSFSRQTEAERRPLKLGFLLRESLKLLRSSIPSSINIQQNILSRNDIVMADATQISQVLLNLCTNAVHAMRETGGMLEISLRDLHIDTESRKLYPDLRPGDYIQLSVSDSGHGIDPTIISRIFDPYFTTKKVGEGTGLGLAVVHGIVKSHGGIIWVESQPGQGTIFHVLLPSILTEPDSGAPVMTELPKGHERILFVEDERAVAEAFKLLLEKLGYIVTLKTSSLEALELFRNHAGEFDLVITDQTMPVMTGLSLAKEMLKIRPDLCIILCTGFSEQVNEENAKAIGIKAFIMKPIMMQEMAKILRKVLGKGEGVLPFSS